MDVYLVKDLLDRSLDEKKLYAFHEYGESGFYCGYVLSYNTDSVQIMHYTKYGEPDGTLSIDFSNIKFVSIQGEYLEGLEYLIENRKKFLELETSSSELLAPTSERFKALLKNYLNDRSIILNLEVAGEGYIGFIDEIRDPYFIFTEIDNAGNVMGTALYNLNDVSSVRVNDKTGRKALFLYNWKKETKNR